MDGKKEKKFLFFLGADLDASHWDIREVSWDSTLFAIIYIEIGAFHLEPALQFLPVLPRSASFFLSFILGRPT
jgi:hypothetical protein